MFINNNTSIMWEHANSKYHICVYVINNNNIYTLEIINNSCSDIVVRWF